MTLTLYESIQRIVQEELGRVRTAELAVVQDIHPHASASDQDNYACTIVLRNSGIVLKHVPVATDRIGSVSIPAANELVLVQFVGGDLNAPVITGRLYNDQDRPPESDAGQAVVHLPLGAGDDDAVHLELTSNGTREVVLKLGKGLSLEVRDDDPVVKLEIDGGKATLEIARDGAVKLVSQGDLQLEGNKLTLKAQSDLSIEAGGTAKLKGATVNIN